MRLCSACVAHPYLKKYIQEHGVELQRCEICSSADVKILEDYSREFRQLFKTLIRFYHSEWDYNRHFGGDHLCTLFYRPSKIIDWREDLDICALEDAILPLIDKVYEDDDEGISLHAGYDSDGGNYPLLEALGEGSHSSLDSLSKQLLHKNYFLLETDTRSLIAKIETAITKEIPAGDSYYRARIGFALRARPVWTSSPNPDYRPYEGAEIGAPPPTKSSAGRLNRHATSFLYVASSPETAITEVRPHPGQPVSIGKFRSIAQLKIADFTEIDFLRFSDCDSSLEGLHLLGAIDRMFREPIPHDRGYMYYLPQLLSDVLRQMGFDAVMFNSSVAEGKNLTVFDPSKFEYITDESDVYVVKQVKYDTEVQKPMGPPEDYIATQGYEDTEWKYEM